jgi:hypothetical protein
MAIIETPSYTVLCTYLAFVGATFSSVHVSLLVSPQVQVEVFISCDHSLLFLFFFFDIIVCSAQNSTLAVKFVYGLCCSTGAQYHVLINKAPSG